jgi:hypothetical protein
MIEEQQGRTYKEIEENLIKRMERSRYVLEGLKNNGPFKAVLKDFEDTVKRIDSAWHLTSDINKLTELRITKLAATSVLTCLDNYEYDLKKSTEELANLQNPDKIIDKDVDNG